MKKFYHKDNRKTWGVFVLTLTIALFSLPFLPEQLPIHFNSQGIVDNYAGKWSIFLAPIVILSILFLAEVLRDLDPKSKNYLNFEKNYYDIHFAVSLLMLFIQAYIIAFVSGWQVSINRLVYPAVALLFIFLGNLLPKVKHNYFVGIRTSWTIASEKVWYLTHRLAGKVFVLGGMAVILLNFFLAEYMTIIFFIIVGIMVFLSIVASLYYYRKFGGDSKL
ncbi:MAG: SdpI family protein [Atopostipes suicloacalis]|nr:SdpI family protein [Atopostipes suicloacalis]